MSTPVEPRVKKRGEAKPSPLMEQYRAHKSRHPDAILFFRLGDFYEMFYEDAELASRLLGLTLTSRNRNDPDPVPLAGVPWHQRDTYVARLLRLGHKVAICEQLEDASQAKGLVERGVTEVLTPGSLLAETFLEEAASRYLAALSWSEGERPTVGFALIEASTGEFRAGESSVGAAVIELSRQRVAEWLLPEGRGLPRDLDALVQSSGAVSMLGATDWASDPVAALGERFSAGIEWKGVWAAESAAAAARYLDRVQGGRAAQLSSPAWIATDDALIVGDAARRGLEIFEPSVGGKTEHTLWGVLDRTRTGPGARLLRRWLERPLLDPAAIDERLDAVQAWVERPTARERLRESLGRAHDLERLTARLAAGKAGPRDLVALATTLALVPEIAATVDEVPHAARLDRAALHLHPHRELVELLQNALVDDPPLALREGGLIRTGYDAECDRLREAARSGKTWIGQLEANERERTGIASLRVGYNRVFGYYFEVTKSQQARVPDDFERRQTLANAERFVTPELKRLEGEVLGAEDKLRAAEYERFVTVRERAAAHVARLGETAAALAELDASAALAEVAARHGYVRPRVSAEDRIEVRGARHPVVERALGSGRFVGNDIVLDPASRQILLITGPNMAGKSTYLRTVGLLVVMAQAGSFVPAESAKIGIVDRLFTRVGASDAVAAGHSTFMVEMVEVAAILRDATRRSLVLLDEVGRGTSTYDGLALAWAITEDLHREPGARPRTLFATHYHELTRLAAELPRLVNLHVRVREVGDDVVFLHQIAEGPADRSYGIHVARLAGLGAPLLARARKILGDLESQRAHALPAERSPLDPQLGLFQAREPEAARDHLAALAEALRSLDLDELTPRAALSLLAEWQERFGQGE
ncbi:MAG TPA: DNA mismatch repair protein MutS [Candidatus Eisenbacteria bacterium]|nr:DNA mismatch repair protein MutS [Candidatus Eisenbacteria bacterium]